jgi:hypothetical protein
MDQELFKLGFINDQFMELAGLSVAEAIHKTYSEKSHARVLIICGPGSWRFSPVLLYPKKSDKHPHAVCKHFCFQN